jgi:hypothetical protein
MVDEELGGDNPISRIDQQKKKPTGKSGAEVQTAKAR